MPIPLSHYPSTTQRRFELIERSLEHFRAGDFQAAYQLADMSCQARVPAPEDLLLRSEILGRLGFERLAHADLLEAFATDPTLPAVQERLLAALQRRGEMREADQQARALLRLRPRQPILAAAIGALDQRPGCAGIGWAEVTRATVKVHVFSRAPEPFQLVVNFDSHGERLLVQTGTGHPNAGLRGAAASFEIAWPPGDMTVSFTSTPPLDWTGPPLLRPVYPLNPPHGVAARAEEQGPAPVAIIIPVYDDIAATKACLDSLFAARPGVPHRILIVDDCGPDPALRAMLTQYGDEPSVELIVNPVNLGFIGSVNRALLHCAAGDIVLLNADTIVPPGWLERMQRTAASRAKVGTVTPLSNNGELTSVPAPFQSTPLPDTAELHAVDRLAQSLNRDTHIALPNGVGFCLLITEACRRATGLLNDADYVEGYLEEVDYCLRAAELGFEHLCACDVFVGHAGSQSFQSRKRGLVKHNLMQLERVFPAIKATTHRFVQIDPLAPVRERLQRGLIAGGLVAREPVTLVIGNGAIAAEGEADLPSLSALAAERPLLRLRFDSPTRITLHREGVMAPYRLPVTLAADGPMQALVEILRAWPIASIVFLDDAHPAWAHGLPYRIGCGYALQLTDSSLVEACGPLAEDDAPRSGEERQARAFFAGAARTSTISNLLAQEAVARGLPQPIIGKVPVTIPAESALKRSGPARIAVFLDPADGQAWHRLRDLAHHALAHDSVLSFTVFGRTLDDDGLRRTSRIDIVPAPSAATAAEAFALNGCVATLVLLPSGICEHPTLDLIAAAPKPILTASRYLADIISQEPKECICFQPEQTVEAVLALITGAMATWQRGDEAADATGRDRQATR